MVGRGLRSPEIPTNRRAGREPKGTPTRFLELLRTRGLLAGALSVRRPAIGTPENRHLAPVGIGRCCNSPAGLADQGVVRLRLGRDHTAGGAAVPRSSSGHEDLYGED